MIINWVAAKAQQLLLAQDTEIDEFSANFDVALSVEIRRFLYTQNDGCTDAGGTTPWIEAVEQRREQLPRAPQQAEIANVTTLAQPALDEHELALT
ncbi:MAG: hypothetical protein Q7U18_04220 [Methylobacter sp.]|nr:hypothetical protein [Methylobacter sp.]